MSVSFDLTPAHRRPPSGPLRKSRSSLAVPLQVAILACRSPSHSLPSSPVSPSHHPVVHEALPNAPAVLEPPLNTPMSPRSVCFLCAPPPTSPNFGVVSAMLLFHSCGGAREHPCFQHYKAKLHPPSCHCSPQSSHRPVFVVKGLLLLCSGGFNWSILYC